MAGSALRKNEYECAVCRGVFEKGWSDEEALEEKTELFGAVPAEECSVVCDDCFEILMRRRPPDEAFLAAVRRRKN